MSDSNQYTRRVLLGGAFFNEAWFSRCAFRLHDFPSIRYYYFGFRVAIVNNREKDAES